MWQYSSSVKKLSQTVQWAKTHIIQRKTRYVMAILIAILIALPLTASAIHNSTYSHQQTMTEQTPSAQHKPEIATSPVEQPASNNVEEQGKTDVQATVVNKGEQSQTQLKINNQSIPVPDNGTVHEVVRNDTSGTTSVDVSSTSSSEGSGTTKSKTKVKVKSSTSTDMDFSSSD